MKIKYKDISLNFEEINKSDNPELTIIFIHGFTGSAKDWENLIPGIDKRFNSFAIDLVGHGLSDSPKNEKYYTQESLVEQVNLLFNYLNLKKAILLGYSMGGRVALSFASTYPDKIKALILESTSTGISSDDVRQQRIENDLKLAEFIRDNQIERFVDYWMNIDLFSSQKNLPEEILNKVRTNKLLNNKTGLVNSLIGFSTGKMKPLFNSLNKISSQTLLITGELDDKFTSINSEMTLHFPAAKHKIIRKSGHNVHLENPDDFISSVNNFLKQF